MAFPQTPLEVRIDMLVDGAWSNITGDIFVRDGIVVSRGRSAEATSIDPSSCALTLENRDGRYSPRNPLSALYGKIGRNTRLRVGVGSPPIVAASRTSVDSTSLVAPSVTAEAATSMLFCTWGAAPLGNITGPGAFTMGTERDGLLSTWAAGTRIAPPGATGTATATHSVTAVDQSALSIAVPGVSLAAGFSQITTNRAPASVAVTGVAAGDYLLAIQGWSSDTDGRMTVAPSIDGTEGVDWLDVGDTGASGGPRLRAWITRMPTGVASSQTVGFAGFDPPGVLPIAGGGDNYARIWRITGVTDYFPRHVGEVSSWPQKWDLSGRDVFTPVTSSGILRRLGQGGSPLRSSLSRHIVNSSDVLAYWPCEEAEGNTAFASPIAGVAPATFRGTPVLAADDGFFGSDPLPTWELSGFVGAVPSYTSTGELFMGGLYSIPAGGMAASGANLLSVGFVGGTIERAILEYRTTGDLAVKLYQRDSSTPVIDASFDFNFDGDRFFAWLWIDTSGADVRVRVSAIGLVDSNGAQNDFSPSAGQGAIQTAAGQVLGRARSVTAGIEGYNAGNGPLSLSVPVTIGHITIASKAQSVFRSGFLHYYPALVGYFSEGAVERIVRLCREEGIDVLGDQDAPAAAGPYFVNSAPLGPQRSGSLLELLQQAAVADGGVLYEPRGLLGLAYRSRASRENRAAADLTLSYTAGHIAEPFEPVDDDASTRNDVTVARTGGSSARAELTTGALSTAAPPLGVGRYDEAVDLSLWKDSQTVDSAGWRLHLGTWDEARYPSVTVNLAKASSLITAAAALDCGDQVELTNLPAWLPPGPVDVGVDGYTEKLDPFGWDITLNASPAGPYRVAELDSDDFGRLDSDDSTLSSGVTSSATSFSVAVASGSPRWITTATHPSEFPFVATVGGETVTVSGITGTASPQTWTVVRAVNGISKSHASGAQIRLNEPVYVPQGGDA